MAKKKKQNLKDNSVELSSVEDLLAGRAAAIEDMIEEEKEYPSIENPRFVDNKEVALPGSAETVSNNNLTEGLMRMLIAKGICKESDFC